MFGMVVMIEITMGFGFRTAGLRETTGLSATKSGPNRSLSGSSSDSKFDRAATVYHITDVFPHYVRRMNVVVFLKQTHGKLKLFWTNSRASAYAMDRWPQWESGPHQRQKMAREFCEIRFGSAHCPSPSCWVHINIEPMTSGDANFLALLDELRSALPKEKLISIAAYPPPTRFQR